MDTNCKNCIFFHEINIWGECRRYAPRYSNEVGINGTQTVWPEVGSNQWCGEFSPDESGYHNIKYVTKKQAHNHDGD